MGPPAPLQSTQAARQLFGSVFRVNGSCAQLSHNDFVSLQEKGVLKRFHLEIARESNYSSSIRVNSGSLELSKFGEEFFQSSASGKINSPP